MREKFSLIIDGIHKRVGSKKQQQQKVLQLFVTAIVIEKSFERKRRKQPRQIRDQKTFARTFSPEIDN